MALRIGFDLDGVLADMDSVIADHADELFGPPPTPPDTTSPDAGSPLAEGTDERTAEKDPLPVRRPMSERQRRQLWRRVRGIDGFWESLPETEPGIVSRLAVLASARRWEILFLTRRPPTMGATAQVQSQRWLAAKGFELPSVYVVTGSRGLIAAALALDVVVDDTPDNCVDIANDSNARTIAVIRNPDAPPVALLTSMGIQTVRSTDAALKLLATIDDATGARPGVFERLARRLGISRRPNA